MNSNPADLRSLELDPEKLPNHVAIIMDGNGRWAKKRLLNRVLGHERGAETVRTIVRTTSDLGIGYLTLYAFSTENWERPKVEVTALWLLMRRFLEQSRPEFMEHGVHLQAIGELDRLPNGFRKVLDDTIAQTADNHGLVLTLALSYGARSEIVTMTRRLCEKARDGELDPAAVDADTVSAHLFTAGIPDPDLMIRTSGEMRLSNFLLWQLAYAELAITPTLWPDFSREEYIGILRDFQTRERRFGQV